MAEEQVLSRRQAEVFKLLAQGLTSREISERLAISPRTVEVHRLKIFAKTGARNAADLVRRVFEARIRRSRRSNSVQVLDCRRGR